jgi:DNA-binding CsgD family transcriptional regulator
VVNGVQHDRPGGYEPRARHSPAGTWTSELVIAALRDWFDVVGEPPLSYEWAPRSAEILGLPMAGAVRWMGAYPRWPSTATVCRHFGSWASAVRAANLPPARAVAPGRGLAERVRSAQRLSAAGRGTAEIAAVLDVSPRTVRSYLRAGSCRDCGGPAVTAERCPRCASVRGNPPHWKHAEVIRALRAWARQEGAAPSSTDWTPTADTARKWGREYPRWPSHVTVRTLFGTWNAALAAAGLRPRRRRWGHNAIIAALREYTASHGHPPTPAELNRDVRLPAPGTVRAHFGSLQAALDAANLPVRRRRWNRDLIINAFVRFELEHGRPPTSRDWSRSSAAHPHATTVLQTFGSWSAAIEATRGRSRARLDRSTSAAAAQRSTKGASCSIGRPHHVQLEG